MKKYTPEDWEVFDKLNQDLYSRLDGLDPDMVLSALAGQVQRVISDKCPRLENKEEVRFDVRNVLKEANEFSVTLMYKILTMRLIPEALILPPWNYDPTEISK